MGNGMNYAVNERFLNGGHDAEVIKDKEIGKKLPFKVLQFSAAKYIITYKFFEMGEKNGKTGSRH